MNRKERKYFLIFAVLICSLYSCTHGVKAADVPTLFDVPVTTSNIVGPDKSPAGILLEFEAAVPESASLKWSIWPPDTIGFAVDTGGRKAYFASPLNGVYGIILSVHSETEHLIILHKLVQGDAPDPGPDPIPPDPVPPPGQKYTIVFFVEGGDTDDYAIDKPVWNTILASVVFRDKVESKGHVVKRIIDYNSITSSTTQCVDGVCKTLSTDLQPWCAAAKMFVDEGNNVPFMAISPVEGEKDILVFPMPKDLAEFWRKLGEKP